MAIYSIPIIMKFNLLKRTDLPLIRLSDFLVVSAALMSSSDVLAEDIPDADTNYFVVTENDSTQILFPVLDKPVMTLNETSVNINSDSKAYSAEIADIIDFSFIGNSLNAVTSISDGNQRIEHYGNSIIIKGLATGETVSLFDLNGIAISTYISKGENLMIDLNQVPSGVYILSTKNSNYKIRK